MHCIDLDNEPMKIRWELGSSEVCSVSLLIQPTPTVYQMVLQGQLVGTDRVRTLPCDLG